MRSKRLIILILLVMGMLSCITLGEYTYSVKSHDGYYFRIQTAEAAFRYTHRVAKHHVKTAWDELIELGMRGADWDDDDFQRIIDSNMELVDLALQEASNLEIERTKYFLGGSAVALRIVHIQNAINNIQDASTILKNNMNKYISKVRLKFSLRTRNIKGYQ